MTINSEQIQALKAAAIAVGRDGRTDDEWFHYLQCVHYKFILSMLAERDADKALIAEQAKRIEFLKEQLALLANFNPDWDKLEAAYDSLREHMTVLTAAQKRIAELEARTVTVKLPPVSFFDFKLSSRFASGAYVNVEAMNKELAAAGITLVVGE